MRELSIIEMREVSGAYSWNFTGGFGGFLKSATCNLGEMLVSATGGAVLAGWTGAIIGGKNGGNGGGLLGFGAIGQGVGMIFGGVAGMVGGAIAGSIVGYDITLEYGKRAADGIIGSV